MALNRDIVAEIFNRVDATTLAIAGCSCSHFWAVAKQEWLWEEACRSLWPFTENKDIKELISSLGGFRKFYADCFPLINIHEGPPPNSNEQCGKMYDPASDDDYRKEPSASEFVSVVDIRYKNRPIYSKIMWGIPLAGQTAHCWSPSRCSFLVYIPFYDSDCGILPFLPMDDIGEAEDDSESKMVVADMRLNWILINTRTKQAVNLSSWKPLEARKRWGSDNDFTVCFGSIVPAGRGFPLRLGVCKIVVKCRVDGGREAMNLQIREISMQLEDMLGCEVNEREGLLILQRSVEWRGRSKDHYKVIKRFRELLLVQRDLMEGKSEAHWLMDPICILFFIAVVVLAYYYLRIL